ncbi:hypothetical protein AB0B44_40115, partial [Streptomyces sp. NPDC041003]
MRKYARAASPEAMLHGQWQDRTSKLDRYRAYLEQRIAEGCTNLSSLHRELQERGARCAYSTLRDYVHPLNPGRRPAANRPPMALQGVVDPAVAGTGIEGGGDAAGRADRHVTGLG